MRKYGAAERAERRRLRALEVERAALGAKYEQEGGLTEAEWSRLHELDDELSVEDRLKGPRAHGLGPGDREAEQARPVEEAAPAAAPYGWTAAEAQVYRLHAVEGLSFGKIAKIRGTSKAAVIKLWRKARHKFMMTELENRVTELETRVTNLEDRILTLVFRHGLDGWAATAVASDPKLWLLFSAT